jgi:RNA polymerase I-specific transcription initiation factor RRN6
LHHFLLSTLSANKNSFELSGLEDISGDLDQASPKLSEFLKSVQLDQDHDTASTLVLTELDHTHQSSTNQPIHPLDLLKVYDNLVEIWMASLPLEVSGAARLSKFKIIRKTTLELYLSSVALSLRSKASQVSEIPDQNIDAIAAVPQINKIETMTRDSSPAFVSSQLDSVLLREAHFSLPSPARTPSVYSHGSTATAGDLPEDPVISRLRQYTVSIRSLPDPGKCRLLSHWPSSPGVNPAKYSWEAAKKASASAEGGEGDGYRTRREEARRQRRTEKFLSRERARATDAESQPTFMPSGSQPEVAHHAISSQTVDEQPMTQPDRGAFGSRLGKKSTKKKQRKAGF